MALAPRIWRASAFAPLWVQALGVLGVCAAIVQALLARDPLDLDALREQHLSAGMEASAAAADVEAISAASAGLLNWPDSHRHPLHRLSLMLTEECALQAALKPEYTGAAVRLEGELPATEALCAFDKLNDSGVPGGLKTLASRWPGVHFIWESQPVDPPEDPQDPLRTALEEQT